MDFSWNPEKARRNLAKHGISLEAATHVFADPHVIISEDCEDEFGEMRYQAVGFAGAQNLLVVVFAERTQGDQKIAHIISARKAVAYEESAYADQF